MAATTQENGGLRNVDSESDMSTIGDDTASPGTYRVRKSSLMRLINWTQVFTTYIPMLMVLGIGVLMALIAEQVLSEFFENNDVEKFSLESVVAIAGAFKSFIGRLLESLFNLKRDVILGPGVETCFVALVVMAWILRMDNPVYLMSFATFKAPESWRITHADFLALMKNQGSFSEDNLSFMKRLLSRSGIGQATAFPPGIVQCLHGKKVDRSIETSREEAKKIIFDIVARAMNKANVEPKDVDVLVINCSLFSPTPSLCAMVISHFQMRSDILSYNLSGMGCGASLLAVDLAAKMLQKRSVKNGKALVISTEILTPNLYYGNERGFVLQNTLFRCGGAAMVLSNNWFDGHRALFKLLHLVRTQGNGEDAYQCVYEAEDEQGNRGVRLSKEIVKVAGKCMEKNMTTMGPYVLPISEQFKVVCCLVARYFCRTYGKIFNTKKYPIVKVYVPDFKRGIDHFCIHAGGRAVIDGIEKNMKLEPYHTEPSRMTLMNYGNTSSSSIWYELEYIMEQQKNNPLKKGDRVMQIGFGSGFKCCSGVWLKL
jgi:predicted naringenin-chalcone synthase